MNEYDGYDHRYGVLYGIVAFVGVLHEVCGAEEARLDDFVDVEQDANEELKIAEDEQEQSNLFVYLFEFLFLQHAGNAL